ncbi:MAG: ABC transporter ATP-binding protein [Bosea sp. (in: a-proteobacteria)]
MVGVAGNISNILSITGVTKRYGAVTAVDDVSLDVRRGEFFCLLGPSGCGKTSLMRLVAGFEQPETGRILLDEEELIGKAPHQRPINMMFQSYALFPHLTVGENVGFGLTQMGLRHAERQNRIGEMLDMLELSALAGRKPDQLSGGQKQRVALARALALKPKLLLLDEPLGALDRRLRQQTQGQLKELQHRLGTTFIVVTHDQDEAMGLADRIAVMERGRIVQVGTPQQIYDRPASAIIAAMVGDVSAFDCRITRVDAGVATINGNALMPDNAAIRCAEVTVAGPGRMFVRPEEVTVLAPNQIGGVAANVVAASVVSALYQGDSMLVTLALGGGEKLLARVWNEQRALMPGQQVHISVNAGEAWVLQA